jgi:hypothetical protein
MTILDLYHLSHSGEKRRQKIGKQYGNACISGGENMKMFHMEIVLQFHEESLDKFLERNF